MTYNTIANISLDLYSDNFVIVNAKQGDSQSRIVKVTVTENGLPYSINKNTAVPYLRCSKPDGKYIFDFATIDDNGKIEIVLSDQMLAASGKCIVDIALTTITTSGSEYNISVLSPMSFYLNVTPNGLGDLDITSVSEYTVLNNLIVTMEEAKADIEVTENEINQIKQDFNAFSVEAEENEATRIANENTRKTNENTRKTNENTRKSNENVRIDNENQRIANENNRISAEETREINVSNAISRADSATQRANTAAAECESIVDTTGLVLKSEKGSANGVASLDASAKIPSAQLYIADNLTTNDASYVLSAKQGYLINSSISSLQSQINSLHKVWFGTPDPNINDGSNGASKNGDIYMQIIEE